MSVYARIRVLSRTEAGRAQLSRFTGEDLYQTDWQYAFEHAGDHAKYRKQVYLRDQHPGSWYLRKPDESMADWEKAKNAILAEADAAVLAELEAA